MIEETFEEIQIKRMIGTMWIDLMRIDGWDWDDLLKELFLASLVAWRKR